MCMDRSVRIESKDVPKYAYKVYYGSGISKTTLRTYFRYKFHEINVFNKSECKKMSIENMPNFMKNDLLHFGRISVFKNKKDAIQFCENRNPYGYCTELVQAWKVEIKQTTAYAYEGLFTGWKTLAVDQVKPIERVD